MSKAARPRKWACLTAATADRYELYERSVQATEGEIEFIDEVFAKERSHPALSLREDFCGTGLLCAGWVKSRPDRSAVGVDLDQPTLDYGQRTHLEPLGAAAERVRLVRRDVRDAGDARVDVAVAFNFSYCVFKRRDELVRYFAEARRGLADDGMFLLDVYGGPDAQSELSETKDIGGGATYTWEQGIYDAVNAEAMRWISFGFRDGSALSRTFSYDWRIWTLPELRDALYEAGFSRVDVYWEGDDGKGGGNGVFTRVDSAPNEQAWIAYVAAWR